MYMKISYSESPLKPQQGGHSSKSGEWYHKKRRLQKRNQRLSQGENEKLDPQKISLLSPEHHAKGKMLKTKKQTQKRPKVYD